MTIKNTNDQVRNAAKLVVSKMKSVKPGTKAERKALVKEIIGFRKYIRNI